MQIRQKLSFQFLGIVAIILILASIAIYFFSADYRKEDFYSRLRNKASITARLLIEVEEVDADLLQRMEADNPITLPRERIRIYDERNNLVFSTDRDDEIRVDKSLLEEIRKKKSVSYTQQDYEALGFIFDNAPEEFLVIIAASDIRGNKKLDNLRAILIMVFVISILIAFISGWVYAGRALRPISSVVDQVDEISINSMNLRVSGGDGNDEIAQLANTFNHMLDRLEKAFRMQKEFIANASHELRTPLTAISGQMEVLLLQDRSGREYKAAIGSVMEDIQNLNRTANRLLLMAQASSETANRNFEHLRIDEIIWQVRAELLKHQPTYNILVLMDPSLDDETKMTIAGSSLLIKAAISNIAENGCKYSSDHKVEIELSHWGNKLYLSFRDEGIGIEDEDLKVIFQPFRRGKNAQDFKGHGIGLSLVEQIVHMHKGTIKVQSEKGKGSIFTLVFDTY